MKRRHFILTLTAALVFTFTGAFSACGGGGEPPATSGTLENGLTWALVLEGNDAGERREYISVTDCPVDATEIVVPETVQNKPVTMIGERAFEKCKQLVSLTLPNTLESIEREAFKECLNLPSLVLPSSLERIGINAFWGCSSLGNLQIPDSVTHIGNGAFKQCNTFTSIQIPGSVQQIGNLTFYLCEALTTVEISEGVTLLGREAFGYCRRLKTVYLPATLLSMGDQAFAGCETLVNIHYAGDITQWQAVQKGNFWNYNVPATQVNCSNGAAPLS